MKRYESPLTGNLDIFVATSEEEQDGETTKWETVLIHGDPEGLRSFAELLLRMADMNQNNIIDLPIGAREHIHLRPKIDLSKSSVELIVGRLDAKGTGQFYDRYISKDQLK